MWIAGLPAAVCGWKLEAEKHAGDNPPAEPGAGYNLAYTAGRGIIQCIASDASRRSIFAAAVFLCFYGIGGKIGVSILFKSLSKGFVVADAHSGPVFWGRRIGGKNRLVHASGGAMWASPPTEVGRSSLVKRGEARRTRPTVFDRKTSVGRALCGPPRNNHVLLHFKASAAAAQEQRRSYI